MRWWERWKEDQVVQRPFELRSSAAGELGCSRLTDSLSTAIRAVVFGQHSTTASDRTGKGDSRASVGRRSTRARISRTPSCPTAPGLRATALPCLCERNQLVNTCCGSDEV